MNKTEKIEALEGKLNKMKEELDALKQEAAQPEFEYLATPTSGYTVSFDGDAIETICSKECVALGDHFQKKYHAEAKAAHMLKYGKLQQLIIEFNAEHCNGWVADWSDNSQEKGELYFDHEDLKWGCVDATRYETTGVVYFDHSQEKEILALVNKHFPPEEWVKR